MTPEQVEKISDEIYSALRRLRRATPALQFNPNLPAPHALTMSDGAPVDLVVAVEPELFRHLRQRRDCDGNYIVQYEMNGSKPSIFGRRLIETRNVAGSDGWEILVQPSNR